MHKVFETHNFKAHVGAKMPPAQGGLQILGDSAQGSQCTGCTECQNALSAQRAQRHAQHAKLIAVPSDTDSTESQSGSAGEPDGWPSPGTEMSSTLELGTVLLSTVLCMTLPSFACRMLLLVSRHAHGRKSKRARYAGLGVAALDVGVLNPTLARDQRRS